jgi:hypothetical protein
VSRLAARSLVLDGGRLVFDGATDEALRRYTSGGFVSQDELGTRTDRSGDGLLRMESLRIYDRDGEPVTQLPSGDPVTIVINYSARQSGLRADAVALDLRLTDMLGHPIATFSTRFVSRPRATALPPRGAFVCRIPSLPLAQETYGIDAWLAYGGGLTDEVTRAGELQVISGNYYADGDEPVKRKHGAALVRHEWSFEDEFEPSPRCVVGAGARSVVHGGGPGV